MLTGDKLSTAYNIGLSCNLISADIKTFFVEGLEKKFDASLRVFNEKEREQVIFDFVKEFKNFQGGVEGGFLPQNAKKLPFGILVDEKALLTITENEEIANIFLNVAKEAVAVICCRVSPLQKSQVVKLLKNYDPSKTTLAIGDGGNDVSMIMEAHIGIGIYGEEGLRAAQSSDYAIGEFKVLRRLLFTHGYLNLTRNSEMIIYFFYKNFVFTIIHFFFGFLNDFSGQTIIDDWFITLYNLLFTSLPLGARGILDVGLREEDGKFINLILPILYQENRDKPVFSIINFLLGLIKGVVHALINYLFCVWILNYEINDKGSQSNLWLISVVLYTNILLIVTVDLMLFTKYHTWINFVIIGVTSVFIYVMFLLVVQVAPIFNSVATMKEAFASSKTWLTILVVVVLCGVIDFTALVVKTLFTSGVKQRAFLLENKDELSMKNVMMMPEEIRQELIKKLPVDALKEVELVEVNNNNQMETVNKSNGSPFVLSQNKQNIDININFNTKNSGNAGQETDNRNDNVENMLLKNDNKTSRVIVANGGAVEPTSNENGIHFENGLSGANLLENGNGVELSPNTGNGRRKRVKSKIRKKKKEENAGNGGEENGLIRQNLNSLSSEIRENSQYQSASKQYNISNDSALNLNAKTVEDIKREHKNISWLNDEEINEVVKKRDKSYLNKNDISEIMNKDGTEEMKEAQSLEGVKSKDYSRQIHHHVQDASNYYSNKKIKPGYVNI